MYRQVTQPNSPVPLQIYCIRGDTCDLHCGKFHKRKLRSAHAHARAHIDAIEAAAREANALVEARRKMQQEQQQQQEQQTELEENDQPKFMLVTSSPERENSVCDNMDDVKHPGPPLSLTLPMGPTSPAVSHASSLASQMSSLATSVTLEDIIASARRKISEDFCEIRLPTPVFLDDQDATLWDRRAAKKRLLFPECSLDVPACGDGDGEAGSDPEHKYEDMDSEAELVIQEEPPQFMHDEETEDFEEMIKAAKPPSDAFSNPILLRDADPLTTRKKTRRTKQTAGLLRQQSMTRLHKLGELGGVGLPESAVSRNSSNTASAAEDFEDNSSIDIPLTELSAIVAKSNTHSGVTSPANILQFIEDQKQRAKAAKVAEQPVEKVAAEVVPDRIDEQPQQEE